MGAQSVKYDQYCPIARALDVIGDRWTLLIVRDLVVGTTRFNDLARGLPGLSRSLLTKRLRQLERDNLVERVDGEYLLTEAGKELQPIVMGIGEWGAKWTFGDPDPAELDSELLVWWIHGRLNVSELPDRRFVLQIRFTDDRKLFWVIVESGDASVCLTDPGYEVDVTVTSDLASLYQVWLGSAPLIDAMRSGQVVFDGDKAFTRRMPAVFQLSPVSDIVQNA
jgi:DNA-binding HxlR family transcriptional regulator